MCYFYRMCQRVHDRFRWSEWWMMMRGASTRGEKRKKAVSGVWWVNSDACCPFPVSGDIRVLDGVLIVLCVLLSDQMTANFRSLTDGSLEVQALAWREKSSGKRAHPWGMPTLTDSDSGTDRLMVSGAAHGSKERNWFCNGRVASLNPVMPHELGCLRARLLVLL